MRQLGAAVLLHSNDNGGRFPLTMHTATEVEASWVYTIAEYLDDVDSVRVCPADPKAEQRLARGQSSYVLNEYLFVAGLDPFGQPVGKQYTSLVNIPDPTKTPMAFVISDQAALSSYSDHTHSRGWTNWSSVISDIQPNRFSRGESSSNGLGGSANYLFTDGHVENIEAAELKVKVNAGINPAHPEPYL